MIRTNIHQGDPARERLRYAIAKQWRKDGRSWTNTEMEAAISAALEQQQAVCRRPPLPTLEQKPQPGQQLDLPIDVPDTTKAAPIAPATQRDSKRRAAIERYVQGCGRRGATRYEIHESLDIPYSGVCPRVLELLESGRLIKTRQTRKTGFGKAASVLVAPEYENGGRP